MIWAVVGGFLAIQRFNPSIYYRIAFIASYALLIIFVLSAWAWSASAAGPFLDYADAWGGWGVSSSYANSWKGLGAGLAVGAALGAIVWVLLIVSLVFFVLHCLRDGGDGHGVAGPRSDAEMGNVKVEQEQPAVVEPPQNHDYNQQPQQYQQYPPQQHQQQAMYPQNPQPQQPYQS